MDTKLLLDLLKQQSNLIQQIKEDLQKLVDLWELQYCDGCQELTQLNLLKTIGDKNYCVGCQERN